MKLILETKIMLFFRSETPSKKSIENVFQIIKSNLNNTKACFLPSKNARIKDIIKNLRFTYQHIGKVNHITGDVHYIALALPKKKTILTIHDIGSALNGNFFKKTFVKILWFWLPALRVRYITVISEFTKGELKSLIPFAKKKIKVIPNPVNPNIIYTPKSFNTEKPIILLLGTKPNKNLERTIEALSTITCQLIIIGELLSHQKKLLQKNNFINKSLSALSFQPSTFSNYYDLPFSEVIELYNQCDLVCFASTYEGFGMPIVEAQATGRPVVTSNISSMPEVAGDAACFVDPYNVASIREGILKVINEDGYRENLIKKGLENIKRFKPEIIAEQYLNLYKELISQ